LYVFAHHRKILEVKIIDDEEYEKNKTFTIHLGEPVLLEIGQKHGQWVSVPSAVLCGFVVEYRLRSLFNIVLIASTSIPE